MAALVATAVTYRFGYPSLPTIVITTFLVFPIGMFFIVCAFVAYSTYELLKKYDRLRLAEAAIGIFALVPAVRTFASIRPYGYGIYYAVPLFLVFLVAMSRCIKAVTPALSADRQQRLVSDLLVVELILLALINIPLTNERLATLETSWGALHFKEDEANVARQILTFISEQKHDGRQVAVLPEAPILYALSGTAAPSRWYTLLPGILSPMQEDVYIADLNRADPDYILITSRRSSEYGADYFGTDYDQKIYHWIQSNYHVAGQFGRFRRDASDSTLAAMLYEKEVLDHPNRSR
jgi:hypothetical protein